jgi:hypothetical protein
MTGNHYLLYSQNYFLAMIISGGSMVYQQIQNSWGKLQASIQGNYYALYPA